MCLVCLGTAIVEFDILTDCFWVFGMLECPKKKNSL